MGEKFDALTTEQQEAVEWYANSVCVAAVIEGNHLAENDQLGFINLVKEDVAGAPKTLAAVVEDYEKRKAATPDGKVPLDAPPGLIPELADYNQNRFTQAPRPTRGLPEGTNRSSGWAPGSKTGGWTIRTKEGERNGVGSEEPSGRGGRG